LPPDTQKPDGRSFKSASTATKDTRIKPDRRTVRYRLKIVVTNSGPTSAQGVTAYLTEYVARTYQPLGQTPYARFEIDPVPLPWISRPAPLPPDQRERVTIQPNMAQSAAVATYDTASWELALLSTTSKGFTPALPIAPATSEHWLTVVVSSDNAEPTSAILYFETVLPEPGNKLAEGKDARLVDSLPDPNQTTSWETVDHDNP